MEIRRLLLGCLLACGLAQHALYADNCIQQGSTIVVEQNYGGFDTDIHKTTYYFRPDPKDPTGKTYVADVWMDGEFLYTTGSQSARGDINDVCPGFLASASLARAKAVPASPQPVVPAGQANQGTAIADFNGDGFGDSAVLTTSGIVVALHNPADGSVMSTATYSVPGIGPSIAAMDFNGDGFVDLAVTQNDGAGQGNVVILLGNGDGAFGPPAKFPTGPIGPFAFYLATGDFNGDGHADLSVANIPAMIGATGTVAVLLGKGDGTFSPAVSYTVGEFPGTIVAADFNGDGITDLAALDNLVGIANYANKVWVLLGKGDGTFQPAVSTATGTGSGYLGWVDLNHDGKPDLVIADEFASAMAVMFGNGDGTFQPATEYLMAAEVGSIAPLPLADGNTLLLTSDNATGYQFISFFASDGTTTIPVIQNLGVGPTSIASTDLNGDRQPDLVITDAEAGNIYVKLATGSGTFASPTTYSLGSQPGALALADVSGDGKIDVIAADATGLDVLLGNGDGTLQAVKTLPAGGSLSSVAIADFNMDGKPDVAAANAVTGGISLFMNSGNGAFESARTVSLSSGLIALSAVSGDFNGDDKPDLIVAYSPTDNTQPGGVAVLLGNGDGTFQPAVNIPLPGPILQQIVGSASSAPLAVGDLNGDGKLDVVTVIRGATSNQVAVLLGIGNGTFQPPLFTNTQTAPPMIVITDQNGDDIPDLVLADCCGLSEASLLFGNGDGTFQMEVQFPSGPNPRAIAAADFNGDGNSDLAIIGQVQEPDRGTLSIVLNTTGSTGPSTAATTTTASPVSATFSPNAQNITLSATITSNSAPVSGGTVTFTLLGTTVSANVTNGSASVSFSIPGGTAAGNYPIQAVYNPASGFATSSDNTKQLTIAQATPLVTWAAPASIVSGTPLGMAQLDATANVPGAFTYTPPSGTVLPVGNGQTLSVLFTPMDATDYNTQTATVSINVTAPSVAALTIAKSHSASFTAGATGTYMIVVGNTTGAGPTSGTVTVTDNAPTGLTVTAMSGTGWSCPTLPTCTNSAILQPGQSYLPITVTVSVAANAPSSLTNLATVSGGGSASATASDPTTIGGPTQFAFTWTANPLAGGSVTPASGSLFTAGSSITVTAAPNACYLFSSYSGAIIGTTNPAMLLINAPQSVVANFASNAKSDVTPQMTTQVSGFRYNRITNSYLQSLTVSNGGSALNGPVYVALDSLSAGATLTGSLGTTQCASPAGSPYVLLSNTGIGAGQSLTLSLQFISPAGPPFLYTPRYLAGSGLQ